MAHLGTQAAIVWQKFSVLGTGGVVDADICIGTFVFVTDFYHTIGAFPKKRSGSSVPVLPLKKDKSFSRRAVAKPVFLLIAFFSGVCLPIAAMLLAAGAAPKTRSIVGIAVCALLLPASCAGLFLFRDTDARRRRDIRLVIGRHEWGSSDPTTWPKAIANRVRPAQDFRVKSFAELSERFARKRQWPQAMFAARLCAALEKRGKGERLTDQILDDVDVANALDDIRNDPERRDEHFQENISLKQWIDGDPRRSVIELTTI